MEIKNNIYLKEYTSYKTGGKALYFADCKSSKDVASALNFASDNKLNYEVIGGGSNLLISDDGYNGLIICTKSLNQYIINKGSGIIKCGAGIVLADLVLYACNHGLSGMEAMAGIPGSTGGACKMNAGAFNQEIKDTLLNVTYMNDDGSIKTIKNEEVGFAYRKSPAINGKIVLSAEFAYGKDKVETLLNKRREILDRRKEKQPLDYPSAGSVFRNPLNLSAGRLIEEASLKGYKVGDAMVSLKHANFIVNLGCANAENVIKLIKIIQDKVKDETGILLELEQEILK